MIQIKDQMDKIINSKLIVSALIAPLITALFFGYVFSNNQILENSLTVIDLDNSSYSRQLIDKLDASPYIQVNRVFNEPLEPNLLLINEKYRGVVVLPKDLEANFFRGKQNSIGFIVDDTLASSIADFRQGVNEVLNTENVTNSISKLASIGISSEQALGMISGLSVQQRTPFNPTTDYMNSSVVGFVNLVLLALLTIQTLQIIPRLRAEGNLSKALNSPLGIISRVFPYVLLFFTSSILVLGVMKQFAGLRFAGNVLEFSLPLFLHITASGLLGMLLGWSVNDPSKVLPKVLIIVVPSFLFSNIILPAALMPLPIQYLGKAFPLNWYTEFYQEIALRGASISYLWKELGGFLILIAAISLLLALIIIKEYKNVIKVSRAGKL